MTEERTSASAEVYDGIVIGAGICGVIFLQYARERGLRCIALEKQDDVGGLWNWLPRWQDIQNRRQDYAINEVPLEGVAQPEIHRYVRAWVDRHELEPFIELECEVTSVTRRENEWRVRTNRGEYRASNLIVASGAQNRPWIPDVERDGASLVEKHSSDLWRPEQLADRRVAVVGGGASAWDLLDLALERGASEVHWVYRSSPRWFMPTARTKQNAWPNLRELAVVQAVRKSASSVSAFLRWLLRLRYRWFRVKQLAPAERFDIREHQLIPGRRSGGGSNTSSSRGGTSSDATRP